MEIKIGNRDGATIVELIGNLDGNTAPEVQDKLEPLIEAKCCLILDMSKLIYISSAGIVSLHSIAKLFCGESVPDAEAGWNTIRSLEKEHTEGIQQNVKLLNVPPEVRSVLDVVGLAARFEMHTDLAQAVASF